MTATTTRPVSESVSTDLARGPTSNNYLRLGLAVLLAALVGFGAGWLVFRDTGSDVPAEVTQLLDDYWEAWNVNDGDAAVALMTPGGTFYSSSPQTGPLRGDLLAGHIDRMSATAIGEGTAEAIVGDDPYVVIRSHTVGGSDGYSIFEIVPWGDQLLIRTHTWFS